MNKIEVIAILGCLCVGLVGCRQGAKQPITPEEVRDDRVTVSMSRIGSSNEFQLTAQYKGKLDMTWWITADADLYDAKGKEIRARKAGTGRFRWKEDDYSEKSHFGYFRSDNPLRETLLLDTSGLQPGRYRAVPSVNVFERGKDAHPKMKETYYREIVGIRPGKVRDLDFYIM